MSGRSRELYGQLKVSFECPLSNHTRVCLIVSFVLRTARISCTLYPGGALKLKASQQYFCPSPSDAPITYKCADLILLLKNYRRFFHCFFAVRRIFLLLSCFYSSILDTNYLIHHVVIYSWTIH